MGLLGEASGDGSAVAQKFLCEGTPLGPASVGTGALSDWSDCWGQDISGSGSTSHDLPGSFRDGASDPCTPLHIGGRRDGTKGPATLFCNMVLIFDLAKVSRHPWV